MLISNQKICRFFSLKENNLYSISKDKIVGNMAKGRISKRVLQENKARQIFQKTNTSYLLYTPCLCFFIIIIIIINFFYIGNHINIFYKIFTLQ